MNESEATNNIFIYFNDTSVAPLILLHASLTLLMVEYLASSYIAPHYLPSYIVHLSSLPDPLTSPRTLFVLLIAAHFIVQHHRLLMDIFSPIEENRRCPCNRQCTICDQYFIFRGVWGCYACSKLICLQCFMTFGKIDLQCSINKNEVVTRHQFLHQFRKSKITYFCSPACHQSMRNTSLFTA